MADLTGLGRILIGLGAALALVGLLLVLGPRVPGLGWLGRLPGDLMVRRGPITVYAPIVTSILLSVLLTVALNLFLRRR